jgi:FdhE protein
VADSFLRRWFGGSRTTPPVDEAQADLDQLATARPALAAPLHWLRELLPDLVPDPAPPAGFSLTAEQARAKLASGIPLIRGEQVAVDPKTFRRRWQRVCEALQAQQADGAGPALAEALRRGRLDAADLTAEVVAGRPEAIRARVESLGLDPGLTTTVLRFTLFPLFTSIESTLAPLRLGTTWDQGYCPTCGGWPLLGEFRGLDQSRFLRCGLCAAGWEVPRLWCPFCGNHDHEELLFLHAEGEEMKYRAIVCQACRGYVKMLTALSALPPLALLVADAATLHLDLAAAERGFLSIP